MNRIVLIMPYYGKLPSYFSYFLKSVAGKRFDVLFVSDLVVPEYPSNFKILPISFAEFRNLTLRKLGVPVKLERPSKLCDFRPMYAKILEEYIVKYDFWMFGDCDLVYGNRFNEYLDEIISSEWDVVSMRNPWLSGPCSILRNTDKVRNLYLQTNNWRDVVLDSRNLFWDECGSCWHPMLEDGSMTMADCEKIRDSFGALVFRAKGIRFRHEDDLTEVGLRGHCVHMEHDGTLRIDGKEILVFHYIVIKMRRFFTSISVAYRDVGEFWMDETGFYLSKNMWRMRHFINPMRRVRALFESVRVNGLHHWMRRIFT